MPTISDIASAAGVSKATVSNVFTKSKRVSSRLSEKVMRVSEELKYHPNQVAASLTTKKTNIIGLLLGNGYDFRKKYFSELIGGVTIAAAEAGFRVLLDTTNFEAEHSQIKLLSKSEPFDGSIILAPVLNDFRIKDMLEHSTPFVVIGRPAVDNPDVLCVDVDNEALVFNTVNHLLDLGHTKIGFFNSGKDMTISLDRLKGYVNAILKRNIIVDTSLVRNIESNQKDDKDFFTNYFQDNKSVSAIITGSDEIAFVTYETLKRMNLKVPQDISIVALGGEDYTELLTPKLSTVAIDYKVMGETAVKMLVAKLGKSPVKCNRVIFETHLIEGNSCIAFEKKNANDI